MQTIKSKSLGVCFLFIAYLATQLAAAQRPPAEHVLRKNTHPNILLITIDTLRADHVGCYGAKNVKTPAIDSLSRDGIQYDRAISQVPLTWPSHAAILTGSYPFHNGVQDFTGQPLSPEFRSIAESLHAHGYATGAVVSSFVLDRSWGLARGFDFYGDSFAGSDYLRKDVALVERRAGESVDRSLKWLQRHGAGKPFFFWLHLYDPHSPYNPPEPFRSQYHDQLYDGEIAYADSEVGRMLTWLKRRGMYEKTAIILLSDHGESLGEHGEKEHGFFIYNATIHVPLIVKPANGEPVRERRVNRPVETIAVAPTILQMARVADPIQKQFDAVSLLQPGEGKRYAYSETFYPFSSFGWSPLRGLESADLHYIDAPERELYHVRDDPREQHNDAAQHAGTADVVAAQLRDMRVVSRTETPRSGTLDPAAAEKLRALGYFAYRSPVPTSALDQTLPDPKDKVADLERILASADAFRAGDYDWGRELLALVRRNNPQLYLVPFMLGEASLAQHNLPEAVEQLESALQLNPSFDQAMTALARALHAQGKSDEARSWLDRALKHNPQNVRAWYEMGWLMGHDHPQEAADAFRRALSIQPNFALAHRDLGMLEYRQKDFAAAAQELESTVNLGLAEPKILNFLGICYSQTGRMQRAIESYKRALKGDPNLAEAHLNLGFAYQKLKRDTEARAEYVTVCKLDDKMCELLHRK